MRTGRLALIKPSLAELLLCLSKTAAPGARNTLGCAFRVQQQEQACTEGIASARSHLLPVPAWRRGSGMGFSSSKSTAKTAQTNCFKH